MCQMRGGATNSTPSLAQFLYLRGMLENSEVSRRGKIQEGIRRMTFEDFLVIYDILKNVVKGLEDKHKQLDIDRHATQVLEDTIAKSPNLILEMVNSNKRTSLEIREEMEKIEVDRFQILDILKKIENIVVIGY